MFDARIFLTELESAKKTLSDNCANFKGEYVIHDYIFRSTNPQEALEKVFLRLRLVPMNMWSDKSVVVAIKNTEKREVGKQSIIPIKREFDTEAQAQEFIKENYSNSFVFDFDFKRRGWQYDLPNGDQVDLEDIEDNYSIEFKSKSEKGLRTLLGLFNVEPNDVVQGPSVVAIKKIKMGC